MMQHFNHTCGLRVALFGLAWRGILGAWAAKIGVAVEGFDWMELNSNRWGAGLHHKVHMDIKKPKAPRSGTERDRSLKSWEQPHVAYVAPKVRYFIC